MARPILDDSLWQSVKPLIPQHKPRRFRHPGRKPINDRQALTGILFVLKSGIPWELLPAEMGCGSGMTCWRRLQEWHSAGAWENIQSMIASRICHSEKVDWSRAAVGIRAHRAPCHNSPMLDSREENLVAIVC